MFVLLFVCECRIIDNIGMKKAKIVIKRGILCVLLSMYVAMTVGVIVLLAMGKYNFAEIKHVGASSLIGLAVCITPIFMWRVFRIEFSLSIILFGGLMIFLNTLGEVFNLYYLLSNWDVILHIYGGYGFAFLAFGTFYSVKQPRGKRQVVIYLLGAIAISVAISALWEIFEYATDGLLGTNMQKTIPENALFNDGFTREMLAGTDKEIADFYRSPAGYMYAIRDTMEDLICCVIGVSVFCAEYLLVGRRYPLRYQETFIKVPAAERSVQ